jgi:hypothetical protein
MRPARVFAFLTSLLAFGGCGAPSSPIATGDDDEIVEIPTGSVRDQSETGNCWLYATTAWVESLSADPTAGSVRELSTAYLVYWDFYRQILGAERGFKGVDWTGGSWGKAAELALAYGMVPQHAFTGERSLDADAKLALEALADINTSLKRGALKSKSARKDPARVRRELDRAFKLEAELVSALDAAFGADGARTFETGAVASGPLLPPASIRIRTPAAPGAPLRAATLRDAIGARARDDADDRTGAMAWTRQSLAPETDPARRKAAMRAFMKRIQRALHDGVPVPISWCVDDAGKDGRNRFTKAVSGLTDECAHETLVTDYEVELPDGRVLQAGEKASPEDLQRALADDAQVVLLRVKNSWGLTDAPKQGFTDLYAEYLGSSVRSCPGEDPASEDCQDWSFLLDDVALPPGY